MLFLCDRLTLQVRSKALEKRRGSLERKENNDLLGKGKTSGKRHGRSDTDGDQRVCVCALVVTVPTT